MRRLLPFITALLLALGCTLTSSGQIATFCRPVSTGDSIDQVRLVAVYKMTYHYDPTDTTTLVTDEVWLEMGQKVRKQYSRIMYDLDLKSEGADRLQFNTQDKIIPIVLYDGLKGPDEVTVDRRLPIAAPVMRYTETRHQLDWQLTGERRIVAGMECQGATCDFGGRHWTAWFAPKLAYPYGPYKLGGLPGLILEAYDSEDDYHYTCIGFRPQEEGRAILEWKWDQQPTTKKELANVVRSLYASPEAALRALGVNNLVVKGDPMVDLPYNPIER